MAGVGLLSQSSIDGRSFLLVTLLGSLSLLAVGIVVLRQVIDRDILIVDYIRAINRIRKYFAEEAPQLQPFLLMPTAHEYPPYRWPSSNRQIPMVINSLSAGMSAVVIDLLVQPGAPLTLAPVLIGGALFLVVYILQIAYANRLFDRAERKARESRSASLFESHSVFRRGMAGGSYAHHHTNRSSETTPDA